MKRFSCLLIFFLPFCIFVQGQHFNINFDIVFSLDKDSVNISDEFDIEGEVTNITNNNLFGDIDLDFFIGTTFDPNFYNNVTFSRTVSVSGAIQPGDDVVFEYEDEKANDPNYNLQTNKSNIIIIWPKLGPGESGDSIKYFIDTLFVFPDSSVNNQNIQESQQLKLFPNPVTSNILNIDLSEMALKPYYLTLWNNLGQKISDEIILQGGSINQLPTGIYENGIVFAQLRNAKGKIIKQKRILLQSFKP